MPQLSFATVGLLVYHISVDGDMGGKVDSLAKSDGQGEAVVRKRPPEQKARARETARIGDEADKCPNTHVGRIASSD